MFRRGLLRVTERNRLFEAANKRRAYSYHAKIPWLSQANREACLVSFSWLLTYLAVLPWPTLNLKRTNCTLRTVRRSRLIAAETDVWNRGVDFTCCRERQSLDHDRLNGTRA